MLFAAVHESAPGTKRAFRDVCYSSASGGKADISQRWRTIVDFMSTRPRHLRHMANHRPAKLKQRSMEHEGVVHKLRPRQVLCVHHWSERFNPLTYRGGNTCRRSRPYSETSRNQSGGSGKQSGLADLSSPIQSAQPQNAVAQAG